MLNYFSKTECKTHDYLTQCWHFKSGNSRKVTFIFQVEIDIYTSISFVESFGGYRISGCLLLKEEKRNVSINQNNQVKMSRNFDQTHINVWLI